MPAVNDYVNYSTQGICQIEDIRPIKFQAGSRARDYYVLRPIYQKNALVYVPTDSEHLLGKMRPVLSPEEIDQIIESVRTQGIPWIQDRTQRIARSKEILTGMDERELLLLASCLYRRSKESGKGLSATDTAILKKVESIIEQEFSFSLKINALGVGAYIRKRLGLADGNDPVPTEN